ncbi:MAG: hypothetical protein IJ741_02035 [Schwartzia sp.]|nr:hypothetical protein [Schwartzia sp. (in: firmicutes)]
MRKANLIRGIVGAVFVAVSLMGNCQAARPNVSDTVGVESFIEAFNRIASEDGIYRIMKWENGPIDGEYQGFVCFISDNVSPAKSIVMCPSSAPDGYLNNVVLQIFSKASSAGRAASFIPVYAVRAFGDTDILDVQKVTECVNHFMETHRRSWITWESCNGKTYRIVCEMGKNHSFNVVIFCPEE